jgi:hypothetical protein
VFVGGRVTAGGTASTQIGRYTYTMEASHGATGVYTMTFPSYGSITYTAVATATTNTGTPNLISWANPAAAQLTFRIVTPSNVLIDREFAFMIL